MFDKNYSFYGKHADYVMYLVSESGVFNRNLDVYMFGAMFGYLYGKQSQRDKSTETQTKILAEQFVGEKANLDFLYRLIMLVDESRSFSLETRIDRSFKDDAQDDNDEIILENINLFNSYVLGGVEVLYNKIVENATTKDEIINNIFLLVNQFETEVSLERLEERIKEEAYEY